MRRDNRCTRYPSKDDLLQIFVKCGGSSSKSLSPPPLLPVRWTARPINFFPFLPRTPLSLLVIYQLFALHGSSHFVLTPPCPTIYAARLRSAKSRRNAAAERVENKGKLCQRPSVQGECTPSRKVRDPSWDRTPPQVFVEQNLWGSAILH